MMPVAFSIVLPCYNEAENLPLLLSAYREVWRDLPSELVLVNNGSTDHTSDMLDEELAKPENVFARTVLVRQNQGYGYGVMAGVRAARGEVIGISHADMQCSPADLFKAYDILMRQARHDVLVKGKRGKRPWPATAITHTMALIATSVLRAKLSDVNAQPKVFHRSLLEYLNHPPHGFELDLYIFYAARKLDWEVLTFPVHFGQRAHGDSKWAFSLASRRKHMWATLKYIFQLRRSYT